MITVFDPGLRGLNKKNSMLKKFVFKKISTIETPKSSKLHHHVNKVRKLYHGRYICNNKRDPKIINLNKMSIPKKACLLSFFSRHYHKIMKRPSFSLKSYTYNLRGADFHIPRFNTVAYGKHSLRYIGPMLWD